LTCEYLRAFLKKFPEILMVYTLTQGPWETDSLKKPEGENLVALSLSMTILLSETV
jgi:hypothetical protein